jgi:hypothetical protein
MACSPIGLVVLSKARYTRQWISGTCRQSAHVAVSTVLGSGPSGIVPAIECHTFDANYLSKLYRRSSVDEHSPFRIQGQGRILAEFRDLRYEQDQKIRQVDDPFVDIGDFQLADGQARCVL